MTAPVQYSQFVATHRAGECSACTRQASQMVVDHCHTHGWVRGIVCRSCNSHMASIDVRRAPDRIEGVSVAELLRHAAQCPECPRVQEGELCIRIAKPQEFTRLLVSPAIPAEVENARMDLIVKTRTAWSKTAVNDAITRVALRHLDEVAAELQHPGHD